MANPQKENGYTAISNEILEHLVQPGINGSEYRVLLFVVRKTYGFSKKNDRISLSQFEKSTDMNRPQAVRTIKSLVSKKILLKENGSYKFNKNWEEWVVSKRGSIQLDTGIQKDTTSSIQLDNLGSIQKDTHKRNITKETITKENSEQSSQIAEIIKAFENINPACKRMYGNTTQRRACVDLIENYKLERVKIVIEKTIPKTNQLQFFPTITTPKQLLDKWVALESAVRKYQSGEQDKKNKYKVAFIS